MAIPLSGVVPHRLGSSYVGICDPGVGRGMGIGGAGGFVLIGGSVYTGVYPKPPPPLSIGLVVKSGCNRFPRIRW